MKKYLVVLGLLSCSVSFASFLGKPTKVLNGGTSAASLTSNNVILGNGTSAVQFVAPGTSGNLLTSNGTTWASTAAAGGGSGASYYSYISGCSATWTTTSSSFVDLTTSVTGCSNTLIDSSGSWTVTEVSNKPQWNVTFPQTGHYQICLNVLGDVTGNGNFGNIQLTDGTTTIIQTSLSGTNSTQDSKSTCGQYNATSTSQTLKVQGATSGGTLSLFGKTDGAITQPLALSIIYIH